MDFNKLISRASPSEVNLIFKQYSRLTGFLKDKQAYDLLDHLLQEKKLEML
jgi:hypothetical protein